MTWFRAGGGGIPTSLKNGMNAVLNKKFGTSGQTYAPSDWPDDVNLLGKLPEKTVSGALVNIADGADDVPIKDLSCDIPKNFDGVSKITLTHTGKNLVDGTDFTRGLPSTTIGASIETISASTRYAYFGTPIKGGNYTVSSVSNDTDYYNAILIFGYTNGVLSFYTNASVNASKTVNLSACDYARIAIGSRTAQITVPIDFTDYGTIQLEAGSSASDYKAYEEPDTYEIDLPIGKNLAELSNDDNPNKASFSYSMMTPQKIAWEKVLSGGKFYARFVLHIPEAGNYVISEKNNMSGMYIYTDELWGNNIVNNASTPYVFSAPASGDYVLGFVSSNAQGVGTTGVLEEVMCEAGSSATAYEPFKKYYGGEIDLLDGTGQDKCIKYVVDGVNVYGTLTASNYMNINPYGSLFGIDGTANNWLCDTLTASGTNFGYNANQGFIFFRQAGWSSLPNVTDAETFNAYCQAHPITFILPLTNAVDFNVDPLPQINTHLGVNNFWTDVDGGETEVTYRADIDLALAQLSGTRGLMMASRSVSPMIGEEASLDRENILEEVSENSDNEESEEER